MKRMILVVLLCLCATDTAAARCKCKRAEKALVAAMFQHGLEMTAWEKSVGSLEPDVLEFAQVHGWLVAPLPVSLPKAIAQVEQSCAKKERRKKK